MTPGCKNFSELVVIDDHGKDINYANFVSLLMKKQDTTLMIAHCGLGISGEAGELADVIKREINYGHTHTAEGKSIHEGICEEIGDCFWYLQATMNMYGLDLEMVLQYNFDKLSKRYEKLTYTDKAAHERADKQGLEVLLNHHLGSTGE